jgi:hypothetical protein
LLSLWTLLFFFLCWQNQKLEEFQARSLLCITITRYKKILIVIKVCVLGKWVFNSCSRATHKCRNFDSFRAWNIQPNHYREEIKCQRPSTKGIIKYVRAKKFTCTHIRLFYSTLWFIRRCHSPLILSF